MNAQIVQIEAFLGEEKLRTTGHRLFLEMSSTILTDVLSTKTIFDCSLNDWGHCTGIKSSHN